MMEEPRQICYVCDQEAREELVTESDGRVHVFFVHKRIGKAGRPKKCDGGYNETASEFMNALEGDEVINTIKNATKIEKKHSKIEKKHSKIEKKHSKIEKKHSKIVPEATVEVFVKMFMHTCQKCTHAWVTKKQFPLVCSKCTSRTWNMTK